MTNPRPMLFRPAGLLLLMLLALLGITTPALAARSKQSSSSAAAAAAERAGANTTPALAARTEPLSSSLSSSSSSSAAAERRGDSSTKHCPDAEACGLATEEQLETLALSTNAALLSLLNFMAPEGPFTVVAFVDKDTPTTCTNTASGPSGLGFTSGCEPLPAQPAPPATALPLTSVAAYGTCPDGFILQPESYCSGGVYDTESDTFVKYLPIIGTGTLQTQVGLLGACNVDVSGVTIGALPAGQRIAVLLQYSCAYDLSQISGDDSKKAEASPAGGKAAASLSLAEAFKKAGLLARRPTTTASAGAASLASPTATVEQAVRRAVVAEEEEKKKEEAAEQAAAAAAAEAPAPVAAKKAPSSSRTSSSSRRRSSSSSSRRP
jgi:hypothetical protein